MKKLTGAGVANQSYRDAEHAKSFTYDNLAGDFPTTKLTFKANPYNKKILAAKNVLDFGCGVGRNLHWVMHNTRAHYYGIDTNPDMLKYFWVVNKHLLKFKRRVTIANNFDFLLNTIDVVLITFVFQHIVNRLPPEVMNINDITTAIKSHCKKNAVWLMLEHESEAPGWQATWLAANQITPDVYIKNYTTPALCHQRELCDRGPHNLIIFKT